MTLLLGAVGWGLLAVGAITHLWHHDRLRQLLAMHIDHERWPALALTALEATLAVGLPALVLSGSSGLRVGVVAATALAFAFVVWILRLLLTGSPLPCACSFTDAPTTLWSLGRAVATTLVVLWWFDAGDLSMGEHVTSLACGLAIASAIFVLPESLSWPQASRAALARVDAYDREATVTEAHR